MTDKREDGQDIVLNQNAVGHGIVHRENGFTGVVVSGNSDEIPLPDGQRVYVVKKDDWENLLHDVALSEHLSNLPPIRMKSSLARSFPLFLEPMGNGASPKYILDANIYRPYKEMLLIRYVSPDEGIAIMERSKGIKNPNMPESR